MDCGEVKEFLNENFLVTGISLPGDLERHIESCEDCRRYYDELVGLGNRLAPLSDISMSAAETVEFETRLENSIDNLEVTEPVLSDESRIYSILRLTLAAAAVFLITVVSFKSDFPAATAVFQDGEQWQLSRVESDDLAVFFSNGDSDLIPALVDGGSADYLTSRIPSDQAYGLLETATEEEMEWLMENFSMEI